MEIDDDMWLEMKSALEYYSKPANYDNFSIEYDRGKVAKLVLNKLRKQEDD